MDILKYFAKGFWVDKHLAQWITTVVIMVNVGLGTVIVAGGIERFTIPSYKPLIDYTQGHVWLWGAWIFASSVLMSVPFRWVNIVGLWTGMFWYIIWMTSFVVAVTKYPTAAAIPIPLMGGLAMISAALLTARVIDKSGG